MRLRSGLKLLDEEPGAGTQAEKGDLVSFDFRATLSRGDAVHERTRVDHVLGSRGIIAGAEYSIEGMREGGYRRVRVSPHLAYGEKEVPGRIPPNAVLICEIWLHAVQKKGSAI